MAVERRTVHPEVSKYKPGLIYDADGVTLLGKYSDELAAYRSKRQWTEVLNSYFLLEPERDYDIWVTSSLEDFYFVLSCNFTSACGRYTFWRLINHQAPEAEQRLGGTAKTSQSQRIGDKSKEENDNAWVFSALSSQMTTNSETMTLLDRLKKLFK